jgi:hypothetical protein
MFSRLLRNLFSRMANRTVINRQRRRSIRRVIIESLEYRVLLAAQVMTDLPDYAPGSTALVSTCNDTNPGTNFSIDEIVAFHIDRTDGIPIESPPAITDWLVQDGVGGFDPYRDSSNMWIFPDTDPDAGEIGTSWYVDPQFADASLRLTATGQSSGAVATHEFTDSVANTTIVTPTGFSTLTVPEGGTINVPYAFTYVTGGTGANQTTSITYNVYVRKGGTDYLIAGPVTQTGLSNGTQAVGSAASPLTASVTFNGLGGNPPGTGGENYNLRVEVTKNNGGNPGTSSDNSSANWVSVTAASGSVASVVVGAQTGARTYGNATGNVTYSVDATRSANGNFVGNYSVSGLPTGVTGSFNPAAGSATGSSPLVDSTLTLSVPNTLNAGTYNFTVTLGGVNGTGTLLVSKATATVNVTNYTGTYDGVSHTASVSILGVGNVVLASNSISGTNVADSGTATASITGLTNYNDASGTATLTISDTVPVVTTQPSNTTVTAGANASFSAAASGSPATTVQWQVSIDGTNWSNIAGATSTTYSFGTTVADNGKRFRAIFTNSAGSVTSDPAVLTAIGRSMSVGTTYSTTVFTGLNAGPIDLVEFVDSQALSLPTTYRATIDWGDGQIDTNVEVAHSIADGTTIKVIGSHVYATNGTYYPIITLVDAAGSTVSTVSTNTAKLIAGTDVSNKVSVTRSSVVKSRVTGLWSQTVKINNISGADLTGNIDLWIIGLTTGVTLSNASASFTSGGIPYLRFSTTGLKAGKSVSAVLSFAVPSMLPSFGYNFKTFNH